MHEFKGETTGNETLTVGSINIPLGQVRFLRGTFRGVCNGSGLAAAGTWSCQAKNINGAVTLIGGAGGAFANDGGLASSVDLVAVDGAISARVVGTAAVLLDWTALIEVL